MGLTCTAGLLGGKLKEQGTNEDWSQEDNK